MNNTEIVKNLRLSQKVKKGVSDGLNIWQVPIRPGGAGSHRSTQVSLIFRSGGGCEFGPKVSHAVDRSCRRWRPSHRVWVPGFVFVRMTYPPSDAIMRIISFSVGGVAGNVFFLTIR